MDNYYRAYCSKCGAVVDWIENNGYITCPSCGRYRSISGSVKYVKNNYCSTCESVQPYVVDNGGYMTCLSCGRYVHI